MGKDRLIAFLRDHFRYDTMNSWNAATSYARCIKVDRLGLSDKLTRRCFDMLYVCEAFGDFDRILADFDERHEHRWQIGRNGRSGGYLVLYSGGTRGSGYRSHCTGCGQANAARVVALSGYAEDRVRSLVYGKDACWTTEVFLHELRRVRLPASRKRDLIEETRRDIQTHGRAGPSVQCGRCGEELRVNYDTPPRRVFTHPGKGVDMERDFELWTIDDLRDRFDVVKDFDCSCDRAVRSFVDFARKHRPEERTILVPKTVRVAVAV